jgi:hypothetical protein
VRITLDRRKNTAHLHFAEYDDADVARCYHLGEHDVRGDFRFDIDKSGRLLGIEVKFAAEAFPQGFLDEAELV